MERHELTYGDSQIIAQAIVNGLDKIAGFDKDFDRVKEIERIEIISPSDR
ncbi:MAG: PIN domain-containing protein [Euryarchaeota archaeon]|nr:PIN domain-containing protein [Euryarchaeota archaeon]